MGVECLAQGPDKFLSRKVCAFLLWLQLFMFVFIITAGHGKEFVAEVVRVESTDSSHGHGQSSSPRYKCMRSSLSSHVIMFLCLSCTVEGGSRASRTRNRKIPPQEGVCIIFAVAAVVHMFVLFCMQQVTERSVWQRWSGSSLQTPLNLSTMAVVKAPP